MDVTQLRSALKLSADTSDEEVLKIAAQRLSAAPEGEENPEGEQKGGQEAEQAPDSGTPTPAPPPEAPAEGAETEATVRVDAGALAELKRQAAEGAEARRIQVQKENDDVLAAAVKDGKIPPARKEHWAKLMKSDPEGTKAQLAELEDNVIPITARGDGRQGGGEGDTSSAGFGYPEGLLPEVDAKKARAAAASRSRVASDRG